MGSSSEDSAPLPGGATGSSGSAATAVPSAETILVSKVLTYSDVSTEVARTGRIVLPRIQVQQCLPELLKLCGAEQALPAVRSGGPVKLSVDLVVDDEAGRTWVVLMKTWQNVVSGEHRPTFVLENTADFVRANKLAQGDTLAFCPSNGRMLLRTSLRADQLLPRSLKRGAAAGPQRDGGPAAKRQAAAKWAAASATAEVPVGGRKRKAVAAAAPAAAAFAESPAAAFWPSHPSQAAQAAQALLDMHSASVDSGLSCEQHQSPLSGVSCCASPATALGPQAPCPVYKPRAVHCGSAASSADASPRHNLLSRVQLERLPAAAAQHPKQLPPRADSGRSGACTPDILLEHVAAALAAPNLHYQLQQQRQAAAASPLSRELSGSLLPPAPPLTSTPPPQPEGPFAELPIEALVHAHRWLTAIVAQQEQDRQYLEQYSRILLLQHLQQHHTQQQQAAAAAAAQQQRFLAEAAAAALDGPVAPPNAARLANPMSLPLPARAVHA